MTNNNEKTDQQVAEEVVVRYIERSRDAKNVKVLGRSADDKNWIFELSFDTPQGDEVGKWGIDKKSGMVTNKLN